MKKTDSVNNLLGGMVFAASLVIYTLTLEPTISWWDCSEIITAANKLEIGHPPGAPLHMLLGRIFSLPALSTSQAAMMVNFMSAVASAGTVMMLFWSIVHLARKLFRSQEVPAGSQIVVWLSGLTGSLAFAFTDTFWFSAVEGEVYALSSFFTSAVFWSLLKWDSEADNPGSDRWLILVAYLTGLSIGVHLLSLLVIPVAGLIYYFRKYPFSWSGLFKALLLSVLILLSLQYLLIPGTAGAGFILDRFLVNSFGFPFNSGLLLLAFLIFAAGSTGIYLTFKRKQYFWNSVFTAFLFIFIGYSSYALIVIRSAANPPMNQNHPDNALALRKYLNREQYGNTPFLYGQYYNAPILGYKRSKTEFNKAGNRYKATGSLPGRPEFDERFRTVFPRMYSSDPEHIGVYKDWGNVKGRHVEVKEEEETRNLMRPTFMENFRFFLNYQLGYMYFRYFMWNFAGRQNDTQGQGGFRYGNWISGIKLLDEPRTGPQKMLPPKLKNDPSRNVYFLLPLLAGFLGMFYQFRQGTVGRRGFWIVLLLFLMTGIAIVVYLNQTPVQPRERDYAYVGSFLAFSIWIGLGVLAVHEWFRKIMAEKPAGIIAGVISLLLVPGILLLQNYSDHNRSGRYTARDYARNYLDSCAPDAILFTYGDNDTFPLWYVQEVEGVRPDIRIINMGLLGMDWYISQLGYRQNAADPIPFSWGKDKYYMGTRDLVLVIDKKPEPADLVFAMDFAGSDDEQAKVKVVTGEMYNYIPSKSLYIKVDRQIVTGSGTVRPEDELLIADSVLFTIHKPYLTKSELAVLNIIAANNWRRPVYFNHSIMYSGSMFFREWLQFEGLTYRLVPIRTPGDEEYAGRIDTDKLYNLVMHRYKWGNVNNPSVYLDEYNRHEVMLTQSRYIFTRLAAALNDELKNKKAEEVLDRLFEVFPDSRIPLTFDSFPAVEQYYKAGAITKGNNIALTLAKNSSDNLKYYHSLPLSLAKSVEEDEQREISMIRTLSEQAIRYGQAELNELLNKWLDD